MTTYHGKHYLGAWAYVLLDILYCIPIVGLIFLLVHSFSDKDENRRHYARSYFARLLLVVILCLAGLGIFYLVVGPAEFNRQMNEIFSQNNLTLPGI